MCLAQVERSQPPSLQPLTIIIEMNEITEEILEKKSRVRER